MDTQTTSRVESANEIFVRQARKILVPQISAMEPALEAADKIYLASFIKNLESVGYGVSKELLDACADLPLSALTTLHNETLQALKHLVGDHQTFNPMYPNFPQQVMNANEVGLYLNAFVHYLTDGKFIPRTVKEPRPALEEGRLKVLNLGRMEEFEALSNKGISLGRTIFSPA